MEAHVCRGATVMCLVAGHEEVKVDWRACNCLVHCWCEHAIVDGSASSQQHYCDDNSVDALSRGSQAQQHPLNIYNP